MKIGVNSGIFPRTIGFEQMVRLTGELGYEGIELNVDVDVLLPRLWDKRKRAELLKLARDSGVEVQSLCINAHNAFNLASPDPRIREIGVSLLNESVDLAVDLGAKLILVCGWDTNEPKQESSWDLFKASLSQSVPLADENGITLALEAVGCEFLFTSAQLMHMISEIGADCLGIYLDVGNAASAGLSVVEEIKAAGEKACQVHLKDTQAKFFAQTVPFGEGMVDFNEAMSALRDIGFDGYLVVELPPSPDDPVKMARHGKEFVDALLSTIE
jgi:L-ribulose-5-phosphate 3-epimerase